MSNQPATMWTQRQTPLPPPDNGGNLPPSAPLTPCASASLPLLHAYAPVSLVSIPATHPVVPIAQSNLPQPPPSQAVAPQFLMNPFSDVPATPVDDSYSTTAAYISLLNALAASFNVAAAGDQTLGGDNVQSLHFLQPPPQFLHWNSASGGSGSGSQQRGGLL